MRRLLAGSALLLLLLLGALGSVRADTITMKNGVKAWGQIIEENDKEVVFERLIQGSKVRTVIARTELLAIERSSDQPPTPSAADPYGNGGGSRGGPGGGGGRTRTRSKRTQGAEAPAAGDDYSELQKVKHNIIIVLDRSNNMAVGNRFELGLKAMESIIDHLPATVHFGVYVFDALGPRSVYGSNDLRPREMKKGLLRRLIENMGEIAVPGDSDLPHCLEPALKARPDAIYLISAGVVSDSNEDTKEIVDGIKARHSTAKKYPVHVIACLGGVGSEDKWPGNHDGHTPQQAYDAEEADAGREVLTRIAKDLDGTYRELTATPPLHNWKLGRGRGGGSSSKHTGSNGGNYYSVTNGGGSGGPSRPPNELMGAWRHGMGAGGGGGGSMGGGMNPGGGGFVNPYSVPLGVPNGGQ